MTIKLNGQDRTAEAFKIDLGGVENRAAMIGKMGEHLTSLGYEKSRELGVDTPHYIGAFRNPNADANKSLLAFLVTDEENVNDVYLGVLKDGDESLGLKKIARSFSSGEPIDVSQEALEQTQSYKLG